MITDSNRDAPTSEMIEVLKGTNVWLVFKRIYSYMVDDRFLLPLAYRHLANTPEAERFYGLWTTQKLALHVLPTLPATMLWDYITKDELLWHTSDEYKEAFKLILLEVEMGAV